MKVINGTNVLPSGAFDVNNTNRFISSEEFKRSYSHFAVEANDIVVVSSGSIGKVSRVRSEHLPLMMNTSVIRFHSGDRGRLDDDYLYAYLRSPLFQNQATAFAIGSAQLNFGPIHIRLMELPLPPVLTQHKIAAVLTAYDELIENNMRRIKLLEEMAQRIYREWFIDFRYPGHQEVPLAVSDLGQIPEGWTWKELRELASESRTSVDPLSLDPKTPYIGLEHMPERSIAIDDWGIASEAGSNKYEFKIGDVLFGKIRPYFHKVAVPPVEGICSTDAIVIRSRDPLLSGLVLAVISSDAFVEEAVQTSQGTKMPRANWKVLERYPVAVPSPSLIESFGSVMNDTVAIVHRLVMSNRNLRATRDVLLPRLISGEIDVSDLDVAMPKAAA
jgi:type I restriction enzyme S subunit